MAATTLGRGGSRPGEKYWSNTSVPKSPVAPKLTNTTTAAKTAATTTPAATPAKTKQSTVAETEAPSWIPTGDSGYSGSGGGGNSSSDYQNIVDAINGEKKRQTDLMLSNIRSAYDQQENDLNAQIPTIQQDATAMRNKVDTGYYQSLPELYRAMEAGGQQGGENITGMVGLNTARQEGQNAANQYEANQTQNIRNAITGLGSQQIQAETQAQSGIESDAFSNLISAMKDSAAQAKADTATAKSDFYDTIGAYSNDYKAEADRLINAGVSQNDYRVKALMAKHYEKLAAQDAANAEAAQNAETNAQAWARINKSGSDTTSSSLSYDEAFQLYQSGIRTPAVLKALGIQ